MVFSPRPLKSPRPEAQVPRDPRRSRGSVLLQSLAAVAISPERVHV